MWKFHRLVIIDSSTFSFSVFDVVDVFDVDAVTCLTLWRCLRAELRSDKKPCHPWKKGKKKQTSKVKKVTIESRVISSKLDLQRPSDAICKTLKSAWIPFYVRHGKRRCRPELWLHVQTVDHREFFGGENVFSVSIRRRLIHFRLRLHSRNRL